MDPSPDLLFGRIAVKAGYLTEDQVKTLLRQQDLAARAGSPTTLGDLCLRLQLLTPKQVQSVLLAQRFSLMREEDVLIGRLVVQNGFATEAEVRQALEDQAGAYKRTRRLPNRIGEILVSRGVLQPQQLQAILKAQARLRAPGGGDSAHATAPSSPSGRPGASMGGVGAGSGTMQVRPNPTPEKGGRKTVEKEAKPHEIVGGCLILLVGLCCVVGLVKWVFWGTKSQEVERGSPPNAGAPSSPQGMSGNSANTQEIETARTLVAESGDRVLTNYSLIRAVFVDQGFGSFFPLEGLANLATAVQIAKSFDATTHPDQIHQGATIIGDLGDRVREAGRSAPDLQNSPLMVDYRQSLADFQQALLSLEATVRKKHH